MNDRDYLDLWIHQSKLMWSRLQTLTVVNFAVFGAWWQFEIKEVLWFGALFNFLMFGAIFRDSQYMKWLGKKMKFPKICGIRGVWIASFISLGLCVLNILLTTDLIHLEHPQEQTNKPTEGKLQKIELGMSRIEQKIDSLILHPKKQIGDPLKTHVEAANLNGELPTEPSE